MKILSGQTNYDFLSMRNVFYVFSSAIVIASIYIWFQQGTSKYGVDFLGGHEIVVQMKDDTGSEEIRKTLQNGGVEDATVQAFESASKQFAVRLNSPDVSQVVKDKIIKALPNAEVIKTDYVGPTVGAELRKKGLLAVVLGLVGMLIYVAFRFEFAFGFGAVVAVFHDVIGSMGIYLLSGHTISMSTLAAALTIVGYSMNDTIVIFDRVREELQHSKGRTLSEIVNRSINASLSRTLITQFLTLLAVLALVLFGGGAISDLSLFMFAGMILGCYSTIYIASPIMIAWHKFRGGTEQV